MSVHVPRSRLNRLYVALIVLNCWSPSMLQGLGVHDKARRLLLLLLCDASLELVASIGIPAALVHWYYPDFNFQIRAFPGYLWYNDAWVMRATNEFRLILIITPLDLFSRLAFSTGLLWCLEGIKDLTRRNGSSLSRVGPSLPALQPAKPSIRDIYPDHRPSNVKESSDSLTEEAPTPTYRHHPTRSQLIHSALQAILVIWGVIITILHAYAFLRPTIPHCLMQVYPWGTEKSACALLLMNCHMLGVTGKVEDVDTTWKVVDESYVTRVLILHCSGFQMPSILASFRELRAIKMYNSTITEWSSDAALTETNHAHLTTALFARVNVSNGELPVGILSKNFPKKLNDIEFCVTNLRVLPDDLDTKWQHGGTYYFEYAQFESIPPVVARLHPLRLSFAANHFTMFPVEAFQINGLGTLSLAANPISSLGEAPLGGTGSISFLYLVETNISFLPKWLDELFLRRLNTGYYAPVSLAATPFCTRLAQGRRSTNNDESEDDLSMVMNLTALEILPYVDCSYSVPTFYPLVFEDLWSTAVVT